MRDNFTFDRNEMLDNLRIKLMTLAQSYNDALYYATDIAQDEQNRNLALERLKYHADRLELVTDIYVNEIGININLEYLAFSGYCGHLRLQSVTINNYYYEYSYSKREFSYRVYD